MIPMIPYVFAGLDVKGALRYFKGALKITLRRCGDRDPPWFTTRMLAARSLLCLSPGSTFLVLVHKNQWFGLDQQSFGAKYNSMNHTHPSPTKYFAHLRFVFLLLNSVIIAIIGYFLVYYRASFRSVSTWIFFVLFLLWHVFSFSVF